MGQCEQIRSKFGEWRILEVARTVDCGAPGSVICIDGMASFANGSYPLESGWQLNGARPALVLLALRC
jgi:hypothetical protein